MCSSGRWVTAAINVAGSPNLIAGNIKYGTWIFGVLGTYSWQWIGSWDNIFWYCSSSSYTRYIHNCDSIRDFGRSYGSDFEDADTGRHLRLVTLAGNGQEIDAQRIFTLRSTIPVYNNPSILSFYMWRSPDVLGNIPEDQIKYTDNFDVFKNEMYGPKDTTGYIWWCQIFLSTEVNGGTKYWFDDYAYILNWSGWGRTWTLEWCTWRLYCHYIQRSKQPIPGGDYYFNIGVPNGVTAMQGYFEGFCLTS